MIKRLLWILLALVLLLAAAFYAVGGRTGVLLLSVKYLLRKDYGPAR